MDPKLNQGARSIVAPDLSKISAILDKAEADMRAIGAWDHGLVGVPAAGVQSLIENLRRATSGSQEPSATESKEQG